MMLGISWIRTLISIKGSSWKEVIEPACCFCCGTSLSPFFSTASPRRKARVLSPHTLQRSFYNHFVTFRHNYSTARTIDKDSALSEALTPKEAIEVLKVVNDVQQAEDLLKYIIPKKKAEEIIKRKRENDDKQISSVEQLISIIGPRNSFKFFCSVLNKPAPVSMNAAMFPVTTADEIKNIRKVLSIVIVGDKISWCLSQSITQEENVRQLAVDSFQQISYQFKPRMHFLVLLKEMQNVLSQLPEAELYIVEEYPATVPTPYMFNFQLQMAQAKSMILGLLTSRDKDGVKIISVKTVAVAKLFNTYIGSEKVSGQYLVEDILINRQLPFLKVSDSILQDYKNADAKVKESLSQAILLNLAYWKITRQFKIV